MESNGWSTWEKHVLSELERLHCAQCNTAAKVQDLEKVYIRSNEKLLSEISKMKMRLGWQSSIWGLIGGAIPVMIGAALYVLKIK